MTRFFASSVPRPFSVTGLPIVKLPAGIGTSFIPTELTPGRPATVRRAGVAVAVFFAGAFARGATFFAGRFLPAGAADGAAGFLAVEVFAAVVFLRAIGLLRSGEGRTYFTRSPTEPQPPPPDHSSSMWRRCMTRWTNGATTSDATPMKRSPEKRA